MTGIDWRYSLHSIFALSKKLSILLCVQLIAYPLQSAMAQMTSSDNYNYEQSDKKLEPTTSPTKTGAAERTDDQVRETGQAILDAEEELDPKTVEKLEQLETHFFGHVYSAESTERRITRLERFIFGMESKGSFGQRIEHVEDTLTVTNPDGTKHDIKLKTDTDHPLKKQSLNSSYGDSSQLELSQIPTSVSALDENKDNPALTSKQDSPTNESVATQPSSPRLNASTTFFSKPARRFLQIGKHTFATAGKPGEMLRELDQAIRIHPSDPDLMFERAKTYIQLDKLSSALNDLSDAIVNDPNKSDYYLARAWCYFKLGNSYLAADDLKQAHFVDPALPLQIDLLQNDNNLTGQKP